VSARLAAAVGFLMVAIGVTSWGLISAGSASAHHARAPHPSVSPASRTISLASIIPRGWKLKFHPSFARPGLNTKVWDTCYPWVTNFAVGCSNFGHKEWEWYLPSQDRVSNGLLELVARPQSTAGHTQNGTPQQYFCRSGIVTTFHSFQFEYGAVQVVARMPKIGGMWPALWLLAVASTKYQPPLSPPEIDIVEHWVRPTNRTGVFLHAPSGPRPYNYPQTANLAHGFHTFSMLWTQHRVEWLIDGKIALIARQSVPHVPMFFIANLASFRNPKKGQCGGALVIRSVKIWGPSGAGH